MDSLFWCLATWVWLRSVVKSGTSEESGMAKELVLGLDVGTSSTKAIVIDARGRVVASASSAHPISQPRAGWSEQEPLDWWRSATRAIRAVLGTRGVAAKRIVGVGLSGQMHGSVFVDRAAREAGENGARIRAIRPALLWNDQRTAAQCEAMEHAFGGGVRGRRALVARTGNAALPGFTLPKVLWLREHERANFRRVERGGGVMLPKDFVRARLVGMEAGFLCDVGDASGWPGVDVATRGLAGGVLAKLGLDAAMFPRLAESASVGGRVTAWASRETGLAMGVAVAVGSGDNQCGAIGAGVVEPGQMLITLGTSGVVYRATKRPMLDVTDPASPGRLHVFADGTGDDRRVGAWCQTGCMLSAAGALAWAHGLLGRGERIEVLLAEAGRVASGSEGLLFLPHLTGERCPYADPKARGAWVGLTSRHTRGHLVRSVLEGVALTLAQICELMDGGAMRGPAKKAPVRVVGGGAKSPLWLQIVANATGRDLVVPRSEEGPALGAAILGGVAAGVWGGVREACGALARDRLAARARVDAGLEAARAAFGPVYGLLRETNGRLGGVGA